MPQHTKTPSPAKSLFASDILIKQLQAKAIVSYTTSGLTALRQSQTRPECPILALTESISVSRMLTLSWGVLPYYLKQTVSNFEALTEKAHALVKEKKSLRQKETDMSPPLGRLLASLVQPTPFMRIASNEKTILIRYSRS
ncbi:MAG: hypothetical protein H6925_03310 [Holosporaceae bacterium]|nr:MAG: hypothetical protein H6925_03310 [Holosporaceae bacterium]